MTPSVKSGSVPSLSPSPSNTSEIYNATEEDVMGALGVALAGASVVDAHYAGRGDMLQGNGGNPQNSSIGSGSVVLPADQSSSFVPSGSDGSTLWPVSSQPAFGNGPGIVQGFRTEMSRAPPTNTRHQMPSLLSSSLVSGPIEKHQDMTSGQHGLFGKAENVVLEEQGPVRVRKKSLDIFLSQDPSQSLGEDILKLRNLRSNSSAPSDHAKEEASGMGLNSTPPSGNKLAEAAAIRREVSAVAPPPGMSRPVLPAVEINSTQQQSYHSRKSSGSPPCSVTGTSTSSRSVSPSGGEGDKRHSSKTSNFNSEQDHSNPGNGNMRASDGHRNTEGFQAKQPSVPGRLPASSGLQTENNMFESPKGAQGKLPTQGNNYTQHRQNELFGHQRDLGSFPFQEPRSVSAYDVRGNIAATDNHPRRTTSSQTTANQHRSSHHVLAQPQGQPQQVQPQQAHPQQIQPQQVFYMAVPTPDGQGQVLQPVQMIQMPGHPSAFVLPAGATVPGYPPLTYGAPKVGPYGQGPKSSGNTTDQVVMLPSVVQPNGNGITGRSPTQAGGDVGNKAQGYRSVKSPRDALVGSSSGNVNGGFHNTGFHGSVPKDENSFFGHQGSVANSLGQGEYPPTLGHNTPNDSHPSPRSSPVSSDPLAALYSSPQRPTLDELLGHIRRLSRDQVGCRLLQQSLDEEGARAATLILHEGLAFWGEAMVDPFGNYLFQKILEKITAKERVVLVRSVSARLVNASLNLHGTRSVQKVVELCAADEVAAAAVSAQSIPAVSAAEILTRSLAPAAARLCIDSHGNHVIQRILLKFPHRYSLFVFEAVASSVGDVARHRHGCCVIQRCLDSPPSPARKHLVRRIVEKSLELMQDAYGNYVVQYVLDVCSDEDVFAVCESVIGKVCSLAIQKFSSNVMEKCLERCTDRVRQQYLQELSDPDRISELMMDPFGNYVVQRALAVATHSQAVHLVEAMKPHLFASQGGQNNGGMRNTAGGRRIIAKISRRFPNFSLDGANADQYLHQKGQRNQRVSSGASYHHHQNRNHSQNHPHFHDGHGGADFRTRYDS